MLTATSLPSFERGSSVAISTKEFRGNLYTDRFVVLTEDDWYEVTIIQDTWNDVEFFTLQRSESFARSRFQPNLSGKNIVTLAGLVSVSITICELYGKQLTNMSISRVSIDCDSGRCILVRDENQTLPGEFLFKREG